MTTIPPDRLQQALLRQDLPSFIAKAMATLEPGTPYDENWHVLHLAGQLNRVRAGELRRLMVNLPPRSLKSHIVSIAYVAWLLGHDPGKRIICITYGQELARQQAALFRRLVESPWYRALFPACVPAKPNRLLDWTTTRGGYRLATSIDGSILGRGADLIAERVQRVVESLAVPQELDQACHAAGGDHPQRDAGREGDDLEMAPSCHGPEE